MIRPKLLLINFVVRVKMGSNTKVFGFSLIILTSCYNNGTAKIVVICDVTPCGMVDWYHFGESPASLSPFYPEDVHRRFL
jgi:hypothetical protein